LDQDLQEHTVGDLFLCKISLKKKELLTAVVWWTSQKDGTIGFHHPCGTHDDVNPTNIETLFGIPTLFFSGGYPCFFSVKSNPYPSMSS
jgi:hypothetical protein